MTNIVDELIKKIDKLCDKINSIDDIICGSEGEPGLTERMRKVENFMIGLTDFHKDIRRVIIGSAGTIVTSIIIAMFVYFINIR